MCARWQRWFERVTDYLYPRICPGCEKPSTRAGRHLCWDCLGRMEFYERNLCERCGLHLAGDVQHTFVCDNCRLGPPHFDRARAVGHFVLTLRETIHLFKYNGAIWLLPDLGDLLEGCLRAHFDFERVDAILPVPLHAVRQRERSYNQSQLLALELGKRMGRRCEAAALIRVRHTRSQTTLDAVHRRANMRDAFEVVRPEWVRERSILLVDDVMTTGATLNECARVLKQAGASHVWAITLARG